MHMKAGQVPYANAAELYNTHGIAKITHMAD